MESLPLSYKRSNNECNLREWCFTFAWIHLTGNFTGCVYHIVCGFMLEPKEYFGDKTIMVFLLIAVSFAIVFYRNLIFVDGLKENISQFIGSFIIVVQCLIVVLGLKIYFIYLIKPYKQLSLLTCLDLSYITFLAISLIPFYILYNKMKREFFIPQSVKFSIIKSEAQRINEVTN